MWLVNLQGGKEEKDFFGFKAPRRRAPETISPTNASAAISAGADVAGCDGDLMMDMWAARIIRGPHSHCAGLFWSARPYSCICKINNFHNKCNIKYNSLIRLSRSNFQ